MKHLLVFGLIGLVALTLVALNTIYPVLPRVANLTTDVGSDVADNWRGFLGNDHPATASTTDLSAQIQTAVNRALAAKLAGLEGAQIKNGLVVLPPGATTSPEAIAATFSDQVTVTPNASGQSGVIVPIFRQTTGPAYVYVLAPIKQ